MTNSTATLALTYTRLEVNLKTQTVTYRDGLGTYRRFHVEGRFDSLRALCDAVEAKLDYRGIEVGSSWDIRDGRLLAAGYYR